MSWNDPCRDCGNPKRDCECKYEPPVISSEELKFRQLKQIENKKICKKEGHKWEYFFIVYTCTRCGETTEY